ncbi:hypothetical protein EDC96DRAFT_542849 [Choanephora cucurbitarum]|nr:hypothetical protein EDC96DRAFT_542849 [Choanephora cucurbitarum]
MKLKMKLKKTLMILRRASPNKSEEIPDEVECFLCDHNVSTCNHFMSQFSIDADELTVKTVASNVNDMEEDCVELPDYIDYCDEESLEISTLDLEVAAEEKSFITAEDDVVEKKDAEEVLIVKRAIIGKPVLIGNLRPNSNKNNSCYIDAPFEILLRRVLPTINELFVSRCDQRNEFDMILLKSFNDCTIGNVLAGNQLIRDFVWSHNTLFVKGEWNDAYACFHWLLNALSPSLRSLLSVSPVYGFSMPFQQQDESKIECENSRCVNFESNLISEESITRFLFIVNPTNFDPKYVDHKNELKEDDYQAYFSETFSDDVPAVQWPQKPEYALHARVYSTHTSGVHYFTIGKVQSSCNETTLHKIDNLSYSSKCLKELSDSFECSQKLLRARNTIFICYKLKR